ncbi:hypothetical protein ACH4UM_20815 [Streptomyces sp. NPDC020801]|uniref:hypothetical protein n=1 Tax=Streptomyces sp. NPDC020801 TaxID=3365093 RepID=UPI0037B31CF7
MPDEQDIQPGDMVLFSRPTGELADPYEWIHHEGDAAGVIVNRADLSLSAHEVESGEFDPDFKVYLPKRREFIDLADHLLGTPESDVYIAHQLEGDRFSARISNEIDRALRTTRHSEALKHVQRLLEGASFQTPELVGRHCKRCGRTRPCEIHSWDC